MLDEFVAGVGDPHAITRSGSQPPLLARSNPDAGRYGLLGITDDARREAAAAAVPEG